MAPAEFEARMVEYMRMINKELRTSAAATSPPAVKPELHSPPTSTSPREALSALEMSRLTLWNLYNNNHPTTTPEPQKEALDLGYKEELKQNVSLLFYNRCRNYLSVAFRRVSWLVVQPPPVRSYRNSTFCSVLGPHFHLLHC